MINSRDIKELHPIVAAMCNKFVAACKKRGTDIIITSTYRDAASQNALYAQGRTKPGKRVTNAKAGESFHNHRVVFDWVPIRGGKLQYENDVLLDECGIIGESVGLTWAGRWKGKLKEKVHFQYTGGLTLKDFQAGKTLPPLKSERNI